MDIREWLQNTADREPPDEQDHPAFPEFFKPQASASIEKVRTSHRHKRKRASSDPIDTAQQQARRKKYQSALHSSSSEHVRAADEDAVSSRDSSESLNSRQSSISARDRVPIKSYERRARHKTRADRYDPKPKQRKERKEHRERESKSKRRKAHRRGDGTGTVGLVQSFQLKNGPKNERLTLRPGANGGIFKHGRASAPMAAGGPGLPDLVFNEMKFLRRPREHQDEPLQDGAARKQTKKSRKELRDEEISAYFKRPAPEGLAEKRPQQITGLAPKQSMKGNESQGRGDTAILPPVDLPPDSFLGLGSRGPQHEPSAAHKTSNSYYTWSESIPAQRNPTQERPEFQSSIRRRSTVDQQTLSCQQRSSVPNMPPPTRSRSRVEEEHRNPGGGIHKERSRDDHRPDTSKSRQRFDGIPPGRRQRHLESTVESSQPLPGGDVVSANAIHTDLGSRIDSEHYRTSDILKLRQVNGANLRSSSGYDLPRRSSLNADKENEDPASPTSDFLKEAFKVLNRPNDMAQAENDHTRTWEERSEPGPAKDMLSIRSIKSRGIIAAQASAFDPSKYVDEYGQPTSRSSHRRTVQRGFSRWGRNTQIQLQRPPPRISPATPAHNIYGWQMSPLTGQASTRTLGRSTADGEMLELVPENQGLVLDNSLIQDNVQTADDLVQPLAFDHVSELYSHGLETLEPQFDDVHMDFAEDLIPAQVFNDSPSRALHSAEQGFEDEFQANAEADGIHNFSAFWKPQRLY